MTRKLLLFPLVAALFLAACAPPGPPNLPIEANQKWFTNTVDAYLDAGRSASMSLDQDELPFVTYLSLNQTLPAGQIAPPRAMTLPLIPAVMTGSLTKDGVWDHGAVIATENQSKPLKLTTKDQAASTVDAQGNVDVAFTLEGELEYSSASAGGTFPSTPDNVAAVTKVVGLSVAATSNGTPYVAWLQGRNVMVATKSGKKWTAKTIAELSAPAQDPQRTALVSDGSDVWLAYGDPSGQGPMVAEVSSHTAKPQPIEPGAGGNGISLVVQKGALYASYYTNDGEVRAAVMSSAGGTGWATTSVGKTGTPPNPGWSASIGVTDKGDEYLAWYDAKQNEVHLASASGGGSFKDLPISGTTDGERPMLAVTKDGADAFVAYFDKVNRDLIVGNYVVSGEPQFALAPIPPAATPTTGPPPTGGATCSPTGSNLTVVAPTGAAGTGFEDKCYAGPAGKPFTINFDNKDSGVPHNFAVYDKQGGSLLFGAKSAADTVTGPGTTRYEVSPQKAGTYFFQCDIHPTTMFGTFVVK